MPSLERTTKTLSNAATHPHSSPSLCHFSNVASWMGWGQGTELQYWALLPGKPKSGRAKLSQLGTPTTESSCEAIYTGKSCGSQIDGNFVPIKEPMTWREVRLCLGLKIWFFLILVETNFNLKKSFCLLCSQRNQGLYFLIVMLRSWYVFLLQKLYLLLYSLMNFFNLMWNPLNMTSVRLS